ncbi:glycosyltransferase family 4 protein [Pseudomonas putida]|uniref:MraY family glycosyltransferase n=1 Tax=Pseudomonas putida TaxID=303 RepID=UPI00125F2A05|nr:glycosyltransferase family 4 protein [Pseudomonas putida]KAB5619166.1 glycosyltransferase family 4 protein [Pseudomonas putida]
MIIFVGLAIGALAASFWLTAVLRRYALSRSLLDIPNSRSSHSRPTPRGGGVAIVLSFLAALVVLWGGNGASTADCLAVVGAGGGVAIIGFMDDHGHVAARWRLIGHFAAAAWALFWLGGWPTLTVFGFPLELGWVGTCIGLLYLVWMLNLYNFMDGIDGIAGVEALSVCLGACLLYGLAGYFSAIWMPLLLALSAAGFLLWNFPPARIFMGDAGSGFLGVVLGTFSLAAAGLEGAFFWSWLILLGVFIVDATVTLMRRLFRGEKVHEAHRSHAYQYASRHFGRHLPVTLGVLAINFGWLLPIALLVSYQQLEGVVGLSLAYAPLVVLVLKFHAGKREADVRMNE